MKLLSQYVIEEFYKPFTQKSHELGAYSRAQCAGAPCDIISAYAVVDVPETEALLYEPTYANIVASAAALAGKRVVTCETFTCLYGFPADHQSRGTDGRPETAGRRRLCQRRQSNHLARQTVQSRRAGYGEVLRIGACGQERFAGGGDARLQQVYGKSLFVHEERERLFPALPSTCRRKTAGSPGSCRSKSSSSGYGEPTSSATPTCRKNSKPGARSGSMANS